MSPLKHMAWMHDADRLGHYTVIFDGAVLLDGARDPEHDTARALVALGHTGRLTMWDARTDAHRSTVAIEAAAKMTVREDQRRMRLVKWKPMPTDLLMSVSGDGAPYSPEAIEEAA